MRIAVAAVVLMATPAFADKMEKDDLPSPKREVAIGEAKVAPPPIPAFELPTVDPGFRGLRELRVRGTRLMGTEVRVKGYVTWIYDCPASLAMVNPEATHAQIMMSIDSDPTLCDTPKFYIGDSKDTSRDASVWIVEVPRAPTKSERQKLPKSELRSWPAAPSVSLGDYVAITGIWGSQSAHEQNPDGLIIYKRVERTTPPAAASASPATPPPVKEVDIPVVRSAALRKVVDPEIRNNSVDHLNACNKAIVAKQYEAAITECKTATTMWDGNHLAWHAWASAHMAKMEWVPARNAAEKAVTLRPDQGMYQLYYGISAYEAERERVRNAQAARDHKRPEDVIVNPASLRLDVARDALLRAVKLSPELWRGHYYLGRLYRDLDDPRRAAHHFSQAIQLHSTYRFAYAALVEMYRRWDYTEQALTVSLLGTVNVPANEAGELWFEAGMAYEAKHADVPAIDAFSKAIAANLDDLNAKFQRGQLLFRRGDFAAAKADLEEVSRSADPRVSAAKPIATQLLAQMSHRQK